MADSGDDPTIMLHRWKSGDEDAGDRLLRFVYSDLHRIARGYMRGERANHTLQPTALVNEAWIRLARSATPPRDRQNLFRTMAAFMRRLLVDHARRRKAARRGGGAHRVELDEHGAELAAPPAADAAEAQLARLDAAVAELTRCHPRAAEIIELRTTGGLSIEEAAAKLSISPGTVKRDYALAKAFLLDKLQSPD